MRKFFTVLVVAPVAVVFLAFAIANRQLVTVSFDPFNSSNPALGVTLPLFLVLIVVAITGVIAGSVATWFRQRRWRRLARQHEADARDARAQLAQLQAASAPFRGAAAPTLLPFPGADTPRDKHGATL